MNKDNVFIRDLTKAWRDEMLSARNYHALAEKERDKGRRAILKKMAEAEERHAQNWLRRLEELGEAPGAFVESTAEKTRRWMLLRSSPHAAVQMLEAGESEADQLYDRLMAATTSKRDKKILLEAQQEEKAHSRMLQEMGQAAPPHHPQSRLENILKAEKWHVTAGGWIGQAIYGVNDGLGAAFGVVSGVAGATSANGEFVLLSGLAAMIASALSMGSGAYLATKSEREVYEAELDRERRELREHPEEEMEEMELFYQLKGFSPSQSKMMARRLAKHPDQMLKTLAHEELGLSEQTFPNPWKSAVSATISTAVGAAVPILPFFFATGITALVISAV
ncbi:MAG TPA: VIT1/CCC1 transporter family protein, partial [Bacteroidota bacterium]|nr:VIT1/CCC1 transporter family protein [Bacteroidota bacterium]